MNGIGSDSLVDLFHPEPVQWGLRGDPFLWREMRDALREHPRPSNEVEWLALLRATWVQLLGDAPIRNETAYVERFASGGMSSGQVSLAFWRDTALPLLCRRYSDATRQSRLCNLTGCA